MSHQFSPDVEQLIRLQMATGKFTTENDLMRNALSALSQREDDLNAVREAIDEWQAGDDGISVEKTFNAIRQKQGIME